MSYIADAHPYNRPIGYITLGIAMERRNFPRLASDASVEIVAAGGHTYPAILADISLSGAQLLCDRPTAERVAPAGPGEIITIRMRLLRPDRSKLRIQAGCVIMAMREAGDDEIRLGVHYQTFDADSYAHLETFIDDWLT